MMVKQNIVVFTGAGISAESGIPTFRDSNGMWNKYDAKKLASVAGFDGHLLCFELLIICKFACKLCKIVVQAPAFCPFAILLPRITLAFAIM